MTTTSPIERIVDVDRHFFGDGSLSSARTREDVAILVLGKKTYGEARCRHAVYTLLCRNDYQTEEAAIVRALEFEPSLSEGRIENLKQIIEAPIVFYVGQSRDVISRLYGHIEGQGGFITSIFPPQRLVSIDWYRSERKSRNAERERARELEQEHPAAYVAGGR